MGEKRVGEGEVQIGRSTVEKGVSEHGGREQ